VRPENPERHAVGKLDRGGFLFVPVARIERPHRGAFVEELLEAGFALVACVLVGLVEPERGAGQVRDDVGNPDLAHARLATLDGGDN